VEFWEGWKVGLLFVCAKVAKSSNLCTERRGLEGRKTAQAFGETKTKPPTAAAAAAARGI